MIMQINCTSNDQKSIEKGKKILKIIGYNEKNLSK